MSLRLIFTDIVCQVPCLHVDAVHWSHAVDVVVTQHHSEGGRVRGEVRWDVWHVFAEQSQPGHDQTGQQRLRWTGC